MGPACRSNGPAKGFVERSPLVPATWMTSCWSSSNVRMTEARTWQSGGRQLSTWILALAELGGRNLLMNEPRLFRQEPRCCRDDLVTDRNGHVPTIRAKFVFAGGQW